MIVGPPLASESRWGVWGDTQRGWGLSCHLALRLAMAQARPASGLASVMGHGRDRAPHDAAGAAGKASPGSKRAREPRKGPGAH